MPIPYYPHVLPHVENTSPPQRTALESKQDDDYDVVSRHPVANRLDAGRVKRHTVYDLSHANGGHRPQQLLGFFNSAPSARRFADKITALHTEMWRFTAERHWNIDLLDHYREWWRRPLKLRSTLF
jgi:hypothetical protein